MNNKNAAYINQCIESMLPRLCNGSFCQGNLDFEPLENDIEVFDDDVDATGFSSDFVIIHYNTHSVKMVSGSTKGLPHA